MATTKYWPDRCDRANIKKSNDCSDVITFWDCLFGKDRWKDLYRKRSDLCEEAGQIQRITTQKVFSKPHLYHTTTASNKPKKSENQARKTKTIFHREVYSLEIEPTNLLRYIWPWKKKDRKVKHNAEKKKNVQEERTNQNEAVKIKKRFVKRRIREEQDEELERNTNNDGVNVRRMQTDSIGRRQREYTGKMYHSRTYENDQIFLRSNSRSPVRKVPSPTFITAQLTDLSIKIDKLENTIINLSSEKQSNLNEQGVPVCQNNVKIPGKKKIRNNTSKQGRNNVRLVSGRSVNRILNSRNKTKNSIRFLKVNEKITNEGINETQSYRNVTKQSKYTIRRSKSNPSLLRIHAPKYSKCHKDNIDACILIHTQKKDVCVHGRYLQIKQNQSWWDQVKNIFSVSFIDKVFYKNTEKKNEDNNNYETKIADSPKNCDNSEFSSDNDSFHSFDEYDLGEELNSRFLNNRSVSYTILNNSSMVMADYDHNKKQEKTVENTLYKKMDVLDRDGILRGNTSESTEENYHRNNKNPVESIENGNSKAVQNSVKSHSVSFHNMLGEMYLSKKYGFLYESIQRDYCDESNSYSMNKDSHNENKHFEMEQWNNEYLRQNGDVLCDSEEEAIKIYGVGTSKNKTETHKKRVMTFTKTHSEFKIRNSKEYEEKLTKTMKSEYSETYFRDSSFFKQFTKDGFYSFFPFYKTELQKKEENNTVFPPNLAGTRFYQVYECGELLR